MVLSADGERGPSRRSRPPGLKLAEQGAGGRRGARTRALSVLDRAILGSVMDERPAHAYAIVGALRHPDGEPMFVESSIYRAITRLAGEGYLEEGVAVTTRGPRPTYVPTLKGIEAMHRWVRTPAGLPIQVSNEAWLRIASTRFGLSRDVLQGLSTLPADLDRRSDDLELVSRVARAEGSWDMASELEYQLERELLDACRRWALRALHVLESNPYAPPGESVSN